MTAPHPVAVIGAGAAGLMAALFAARGGAPVVLVERTHDGGRKILISGGGRCNVLPSVPAPERFVTDSSPNSLRRILRSWPLEEQRAFLERELEMPLVLEPETGKLFPETQRARDVRDRLLERVREAGARVWFGATVTGLEAIDPTEVRGSGADNVAGRGAGGAREGEGPPPRWRVRLSGAPDLEASAVILATGGLSVPATGSDGTGLDIVRGLGHTVRTTYPALTPLTADPHPHAHLAGVSLEVTIRAPDQGPTVETTDGFLVTHRGWSGPSVLDASHVAVRSRLAGGPRAEVTVQWTARDRAAWDAVLMEKGTGTVGALLSRELPSRLAAQLLTEADVPADRALARLTKDERQRLTRHLAAYPLPWTGDEGYKKAEVTGGGVALEEVDPGTMESRVLPGLFLCGEILDAFGPIGGHNFMWAWATGRAAGRGAARAASAG